MRREPRVSPHTLTPPARGCSAEAEPRGWVARLRASGPAHDAAVAELHGLLLRAARFEVRRRGGRGSEADDLAIQAAHDAAVAVLAKLDTFRGASRFTTWAYKFALLEAATAMRRRAWRDREVTLRAEDWDVLPAGGPAPAAEAETAELLGAVSTAVRDDLTPHQRAVLLALAVDGVPIDVLAERLGSTRGALYKTLHDARRKLRRSLGERGLLPGEMST